MSWYDYSDDFDSAAGRSSRIEKEIAKRRKNGESLVPVLPTGNSKEMSTTFWGRAWNRNLVAYSDYESRLPRGRTYFRSGKVLDVEITPGSITSVVAGSRLYDVNIQIKPLPAASWKEIVGKCQGKIVGLVELLAGELSGEVMKIVTDLDSGLFPSDRQIVLGCSCPDWAGMCKHCAATLYAVGSLLDENPRHMFTLRGVDPRELSGNAKTTIAALTTPSVLSASRRAALNMAGNEFAEMFGIELTDLSALELPAELISASAPAPPAAKKKMPKAERAS